ncbi:MAG: hypothetical protein WBK77_01955 [Alphaproteobacteria bacterium]
MIGAETQPPPEGVQRKIQMLRMKRTTVRHANRGAGAKDRTWPSDNQKEAKELRPSRRKGL